MTNIATFLTIALTLFLADEGPKSPGTFAEGTTGDLAWSTLSRAASSDNLYAQTSSPYATTMNSTALKCTNYGFSIPSGATIDGIEVGIEKRATSANDTYANVRDFELYLIKGGSTVGTNKANTSTNWSQTESYVYYGSSTDLWGTTWADSDINASNFGVSLRVTSYLLDYNIDELYAYVDHVTVKIYYTASGGGSSTANALLFIGN